MVASPSTLALKGEDDLFDAFFIDAGEKLLDVELVRADASID